MPSLAPITIKDGAATPADHVFTPDRIDSSGVATFKERVSGVPIGYPTLTSSVRAPAGGSTTYKLGQRLTMPKVVTTTDVTGKIVTSVDFQDLVDVSFVLSEKGDTQGRKNLRVLLANWLLSAQAAAVIDNVESFY